MAVERMRLGVVGVSRAPTNPWAMRGFAPSGVLTEAPATPPMSRLGPASDLETWYLGPAELALYAGETAHYRDNLSSGRPSLWVALRPGPPPQVTCVTADPYEGEGLAGDPGLVVEAVPMPPSIARTLAAFFAAHHVERAFQKRTRNRVDLEALGRREPRVSGRSDR